MLNLPSFMGEKVLILDSQKGRFRIYSRGQKAEGRRQEENPYQK
jgi:hypothetical protein